MDSQQVDRLINVIARVSGFLELIEHDLRQQTGAIDALTEALYTNAAVKVAAANGVDPDLDQLNQDVQAWLKSRIPQEATT